MDTIICLSDSDSSPPPKAPASGIPRLSPLINNDDNDFGLADLPDLDMPSNYSPVRRRKSPPPRTSPVKEIGKNEPTKAKRKPRNPKPIDEEKLKRQKDAKIAKLEKQITMKTQKNNKKGECMKFITVELDEGLKTFDFYQQSLAELDKAGVKYKENSMIIPNSATWTMIHEEYYIDNDTNLQTNTRKEEQKIVLIIWGVEQVVRLINDNEFISTITSISTILSNKRLSIIIYGLEEYFSVKKNSGGKKKDQQKYQVLKNLPKIDRKLFEIALVDLQLLINCNFRLIDDYEEMSLVIYQYSKSFAETELKKIEAGVMEEMDFYAAGDNRDTVGVDKDGNGLKNLWLKQLCIFNAVGLATAEAVCAVYPSPVALMNVCIHQLIFHYFYKKKKKEY